jgi:multidrug resistance efflux pump
MVVLALALAASSLAAAGDKGPGCRDAGLPEPVVLPELPPDTLPPVALPPLDPASVAPDRRAPREGDKDTSIRVPGTIRPASQASVSPLVSGQVTRVLVEEGDVVKAGQVLATLDRTKADLGLRKAEAQLERAKAAVNEAEAGVGLREGEVKRAEAGVKQAEAQRSYARKKLERMRALLGQRSIDQSVVDEAEAQFQAAEAQVEQASAALLAARSTLDKGKARVTAAKADVAIAQADRDLAKWNVEATEIRAPAAGTVLARHVRVGDGVGPAQANGRPTPLFEIADLTQLDAAASVPAKDLAELKVGQKCEVRVDAVPDVVYHGKVSRISPVVSRQNGTVAVRVRIELPQDDHRLVPGMFGAVRIPGKE